MQKAHIVETKQVNHVVAERKILFNSDCPVIVK